MDAAPPALGDFLKEQTWFFGLCWGHAQSRNSLSYSKMTWKPNCAVSKVRCLQSVCPPWLQLTGFVARASFKGTSSSDSWTVGVLMYVRPYLCSRLDSVTLLMPNTPKTILSARQKGHKSGFSENPIFLHLAGFCWQPLIQFHTASECFTPGLSPNQQHNFYIFFSSKEIFLGLKRSPGPNSVLYCPRQAEKADRDST